MGYSFLNDYGEGCIPEILEILGRSNHTQEIGYGEDTLCAEASMLIKEETGCLDADVHFASGATQANKIIISSALRPFEAVVAASTGHIAVHEAGAIEATGHKICTVPTDNGKLTPPLVDQVVKFHSDEHMVKPRMVYISNTTEVGTVYTKKELMALKEYCVAKNLYLFVDGARLAQALTSKANDVAMKEFAALPDIFYIGGTKNGALLGEAIVINNDILKENFRFNLKQNGALLAKGRILGAQFIGLFAGNLFYKNGVHANSMAMKLADGIREEGYGFLAEPVSNQIFPILPNKVIDRLLEDYQFYSWTDNGDGSSSIRLVTSWATLEEEVDGFINAIKSAR
jgi:threonine aldolase